MNENENLVTEEVTENVEQTTEQTPKTYTQEEVDAIVGKRLARKEARIRKEYDRQYGDLVETLKAGTGKQNVEELNDTFTKFYEGKGIKINKKPTYTDQDLETLAAADADEFIRGGFEDVVEEADRLKEIGVERMTAREKAVFTKLAAYVKDTEQSRELAKIGVTEDVYNSSDFKDFSKKFNPNTPIAEIYDIYAKTQPKKEIRTMGSMKNNNSADNGVKDFYTPEEARKFTRKELDENPALFAALESSMKRWKK